MITGKKVLLGNSKRKKPVTSKNEEIQNRTSKVSTSKHEPAKVDHARIEKAVREILIAVGEDPDREGLLETPARVARMYAEIFSGLQTVSACIHKKIRPLFPLGGIAHHGVVAVETEQFEIGFEIHHGYSPITLRQ